MPMNRGRTGMVTCAAGNWLNAQAPMPGKERINVVWFKCTDLRCHDHAALKAAHQQTLPVLHLYVFDPFWHAGKTRLCSFPKTGPIRNRFQIEAVQDLAERLQSHGHVLNLRRGTDWKLPADQPTGLAPDRPWSCTIAVTPGQLTECRNSHWQSPVIIRAIF